MRLSLRNEIVLFRVKALNRNGEFEDFFYVPIEIAREISFNYFYRSFIYFANFYKADSIEYENGSGWALPLIFYKVTFGALLNLLTTTLQSTAFKNASM
jgi:hypothetical protein